MKGQTVYIECFAYGYPPPSYKWSRMDGQKLTTNHQILNFGRVLKIENVRQEDAVRYKCTAKNSLGIANAEIQLIIQTPPTIIKPLIDQIVSTNSTATFDCIVSDINNLHTTIEWFRNGTPLVPLLMAPDDRNRFKIHGQSMSISKTSENDSGIYQCIASNDVGSVSSATRLTIKDIAPRFHGNVFPKRLYLVEGSKLDLPCLYQAIPKGTSMWTLSSGDPISDRGRIRQKEEPNGIVQLEIDPVKKLDEGEYVCVASNVIGEARGVVYVVVLARPSMTIHPSTADQDDQNIRITCEAELFCDMPSDCPEPLFDWQFNDRPIRSLSNGQGIRIQAIESESRYKRHPSVIQTSQIQISTNFSQNNVGRFSCNSIYGGGAAELEPRQLSMAPTKPQVLNVGITQAKLSWSQQAQKKRGFSRSIKLEGYQIEFRTSENRHWRNFEDGIFRTEDMIIGSYIVKNLEPNQKYQFRVRARSAEGLLSAASPSSDWIETPKSAPITLVDNLKWKILDDNHLIVEWDPIETSHQSGPNLRYNVSWSEPSDDSFNNYEIVYRPNLVISFSNKTSESSKNCYTISLAVQPINDIGTGMASTDTVVHVSREGPKRHAVNLVSSPINSTHMNISWNWEEQEECENAIGAQRPSETTRQR
uniref:Uncharacterized protein n=1 Tax=Acrobeloides nanus TaxID=290746 RepID=A0A914EKX6_9BILA